jgi:hypothetical protein
MTIAKGKRYIVPRGTVVRDHRLMRSSTRKVSYPVHVEHVTEGRAYWSGDCNRTMSCDASALDLTHPVSGARSGRRGR